MDTRPTMTISPYTALKPLDLKAARWTGGFWGQKLDMVRGGSLESVLGAISDSKNAAYFGNFRAAAEGRKEFHGRYWSDGDCYKTIETMALLIDIEYDADIDARMDEMIAEIASAQEVKHNNTQLLTRLLLAMMYGLLGP